MLELFRGWFTWSQSRCRFGAIWRRSFFVWQRFEWPRATVLERPAAANP
jgi:hypothetical protein